ncbi:hypothetical protein [Nodularia spumigena]
MAGAVKSVKIDRRRLFLVRDLEAFAASLCPGGEVQT